MSKIDLTPLDTTATDVFPSSIRSAEMSIESWPSRWTPPIPPVAKIFIPTEFDMNVVAATVVPPLAPFESINDRSRRDVLNVSFPFFFDARISN